MPVGSAFVRSGADEDREALLARENGWGGEYARVFFGPGARPTRSLLSCRAGEDGGIEMGRWGGAFKARFCGIVLLMGALTNGLVAGGGSVATADEKTAESKEAVRLENARVAFEEMRKMPDAEIPDPLLKGCRCVAVIPGVIKGALGWGGRHGRGVVSCRDSSGRWGPASFLTLTGGSFGLQIGVEKTDVILFFMNERGARSLVKGEFTLSGQGSVAAGPVGRTAEAGTDIKLDAEIYSYARAKGLFAGISLEGAKLGSDKKAVERFYGQPVDPKQLLFEHKAPKHPPALGRFLEVLP